MKYWIIAPYSSQQADVFEKVWRFDLENGCIAVGWRDLGNIFSTDMTESEYNKKYNALYGPKVKKISVHHRKSFWQFWHDIDVGDIFVARKGRKKIIGIGRVKSKPYYDENKGKKRVGGLTDSYYSNFIDVEWDSKEVSFEKSVLPMSAIQQISREKYSSLMKGATTVYAGFGNAANLIEKKKQIILYGPPGTGKTYNTKTIAVYLLKEKGKGFFEELEKFIKKFPEFTLETKPTLEGQYSLSIISKNNVKLAWVSYPGSGGDLRVHLKKPPRAEYPPDISLMPGYVKKGFGGYSEFKVMTEEDLKRTKQLLEFAYKNFGDAK